MFDLLRDSSEKVAFRNYGEKCQLSCERRTGSVEKSLEMVFDLKHTFVSHFQSISVY